MNIKITVCCNSVTVLLPNERYGIITEGHGSAIGGRKGVKRKSVATIFMDRHESRRPAIYRKLSHLSIKKVG